MALLRSKVQRRESAVRVRFQPRTRVDEQAQAVGFSVVRSLR